MPDSRGVFLDTNVLVYLLSSDEIKATKVERLLEQGGIISVQVLNELTNVALRKFSMTWSEVRELVTIIRRICSVCELSESTYDTGCQVAERYRLSVYDAMIVAAALENGCKTLLSEDMHTGLVINKSLTIKNPF